MYRATRRSIFFDSGSPILLGMADHLPKKLHRELQPSFPEPGKIFPAPGFPFHFKPMFFSP